MQPTLFPPIFSEDTPGLVPGPSAAEIAAQDVLRADGTYGSAGGFTSMRARVWRAATPQNDSDQPTKIAFDTLDYDTGGFVVAGDESQFVIPVTGTYLVIASNRWASGGVAGRYQRTMIYLNPLTTNLILAEQMTSNVTGQGGRNMASLVYAFTAGDIIATFFGSGDNLASITPAASGFGHNAPSMSIVRLA